MFATTRAAALPSPRRRSPSIAATFTTGPAGEIRDYRLCEIRALVVESGSSPANAEMIEARPYRPLRCRARTRRAQASRSSSDANENSTLATRRTRLRSVLLSTRRTLPVT